MTSLTTKISAALSAHLTNAPDGGQVIADMAFSASATLQNGTTNAQADLAFFDERTLASNTSENIDLAGVLSSVYGATLTFVEIVAALIINSSIAGVANTTNLSVGGAASNPFLGWVADPTDIDVIKGGGFMYRYDPAGWTVTATTGDILKIANAAGASATYQIGLIGRSA